MTCNSAPGNAFLNLDEPLPPNLKLKLGQNIVIVQNVSNAGQNVVRSLVMSSPLVQNDKISHGLQLPGQPSDTFIVGLGAALQEGTGEIKIRLGPPANTQIRLPFAVACA